MKFLFNLVFWMFVFLILVLFIGYYPIKTLKFIGIFLAVCTVIGVTIGILKIKVNK